MNSQSLNQKHQFNSSAFQPITSPLPGESEHSPLQLQVYQEEQIDQIANTLQIEKQIGIVIINEINEQHQIILEIDEGIDNVTTAMRKVTQQITKLIDNEGRAPTYLVAVLSIVLILMLWWVA
jgi:hypothetical protein